MSKLIAVATTPDPGLLVSAIISLTALAPIGPTSDLTCRSTWTLAASSLATTDTTLIVIMSSGDRDRMLYMATAAESRMALSSDQPFAASQISLGMSRSRGNTGLSSCVIVLLLTNGFESTGQ